MHGSMRRMAIASACVVGWVSVAHATLVVGRNVEWIPFTKPRYTIIGTNERFEPIVVVVNEEAYHLFVDQDVAGTDHTGLDIVYAPDESGTKLLRGDAGLADEGVDLYAVQPGAAFGRAAIADGSATKLYVTLHAGAPLDPPPGDFYLGIATQRGGSTYEPTARDTFGWQRLSHNADGTLALAESAISYHSPGILVGTTTELPEPCVALLAAGGGVFARRRRGAT